MDKYVSLKLDRDLINPQFDGYKLSLEPLPLYQQSFDCGVDTTSLTDAQYSFQHAKAFGMHNHLVGDPWHPEIVYWLDQQWNVQRASMLKESNAAKIEGVFTVPDAAARRSTSGRVNVCLHLTAAQWAVLTDGTGRLFLLDTGDRPTVSEWKAVYGEAVLEDCVFSVVHSSWCIDNGVNQIDCLLVHVDEQPESAAHSNPFHTHLEWITFTSADGKKWTLDRRRTLESSSAPDYAAIEMGGQAAYVAAQKPYKIIYDSVIPVDEDKPDKPDKPQLEPNDENGTTEPPLYKWTQTQEGITVFLDLPEGKQKTDMDLQIKIDQLHVGIKNSEPMLQGKFYGKIDADGSTWTVEKDKITIELGKKESEMWPYLIEGDIRGQLILEEDNIPTTLVEEIEKKPFNTQELEECDAFPDDAALMIRIHGNTHQITHQVNLSSHQWLFNTVIDPEQMPAICLRHDVDGVVWQPVLGEDEANPWRHHATFHALGYVKASKEQNRFSASPPNSMYAVLCDCVRHAYVYRQPSEILSPLRNRKTGREVTAVAKQQVVSLESVENVLGLCATNERLFILNNKTLYIIKI